MIEILDVVAVIVAGLVVGSELSIAAFVHPTLGKLPDAVHLPAASALARVLGKFMPFFYALALLLTVGEIFLQWYESGGLSAWLVTSSILWLFTIAYSVTMLVPINNQIASWENVEPPSDWKTFRKRWDLLHRWRVMLLTIAFAFLVVGIR